MGKMLLSCVMAIAIGAGCRWLRVPLPAPPNFFGVALIALITSGYWMVDWYESRQLKTSNSAESSAPRKLN